MKKMTQIIQENQNKNIINAVSLIDSAGNVIEKNGIIDLDKGIFDEFNKKYVGAISEDGKIYTNIPDFNTVVVNIENPKLPQ